MTVYRVKEPFSYDQAGIPVVMKHGRLLTEQDPAFQRLDEAGRARHLEKVEDAATARSSAEALETATSAPGERRTVTRPRTHKASEA